MDVNWGKLREIMRDQEAWRAEVNGVTKSGTWPGEWPRQRKHPEDHPHLRDQWRTAGQWEKQTRASQGGTGGNPRTEGHRFRGPQKAEMKEEWSLVSNAFTEDLSQHQVQLLWKVSNPPKCHLPTCQLSCGNVTHYHQFWFSKNDTNSQEMEKQGKRCQHRATHPWLCPGKAAPAVYFGPESSMNKLWVSLCRALIPNQQK